MVLWHVFVNFMEKEPCAKFCGVLISFHEVDVSDVNTSEWTKYFIPGFLCISSLILWRKNLLQSLMLLLTIFAEHMKLGSFE